MPTPTERAQAQALYVQAIHHQAKKIYQEQQKSLPIDPQGRVIIEVTLGEEAWQKLYNATKNGNDPVLSAGFKAEFIKKLGHQVSDITSVSFDVQTKQQDELNPKFKAELGNFLPEDTREAILEKYQGLAKGRIISLQQETHFHAHLIGRMLQKAVDRAQQDAPFGDTNALFKKGIDNALLKLNQQVMELHANALDKAYKVADKKNPFAEKEFKKTLNKALDKARKELLPEIAKEVRIAVIQATGIQFTAEITKHLSKHLAEETSASINDFVHIDKANGSISFIGASANTSHHQELGGTHVADRIMYSHHLKDDVVHALAQRQQVRVPSLAVKKLHKLTDLLLDQDEKAHAKSNKEALLADDLSQRLDALATGKKLSLSAEEKKQITSEYTQMRTLLDKDKNLSRKEAFNSLIITDTQEKIAHLQQKYQLGDVDREPLPQAFIYNLYTTLNSKDKLFEQIDEKNNKQTQSAVHILQAAHAYNRANPNKPMCLVQNIAVNGWGHELSINDSNPAVVNEAALMTQLASLHTVYDTLSPEAQSAAQHVFKQYKSFINEKQSGLSFYSYIKKQNAPTLELLEEIKRSPLTQPPETNPEASLAEQRTIFVAQAKGALAALWQKNAYEHHDNAFTYQALSVFVEQASIGGCKSANERAQAVNGRVAVLDFMSLARTTRDELLDNYLSTSEASKLKQYTHDLESAIKKGDLITITKNMNAIYESLNLEGFQAVVSFIDQGGHAKLGSRSRIPNTNNAETIHTDVEKASAWQCHKGLTANVLNEFCGIEKTSIKTDIKNALTMIAKAVGSTGVVLGLAAAVGMTAAFPPAGLLLGVAAAAGLVAYAVTKLYSIFTKEAELKHRVAAIQEDNERLIKEANPKAALRVTQTDNASLVQHQEKTQPMKEKLQEVKNNTTSDTVDMEPPHTSLSM